MKGTNVQLMLKKKESIKLYAIVTVKEKGSELELVHSFHTRNFMKWEVKCNVYTSQNKISNFMKREANARFLFMKWEVYNAISKPCKLDKIVRVNMVKHNSLTIKLNFMKWQKHMKNGKGNSTFKLHEAAYESKYLHDLSFPYPCHVPCMCLHLLYQVRIIYYK